MLTRAPINYTTIECIPRGGAFLTIVTMRMGTVSALGLEDDRQHERLGVTVTLGPSQNSSYAFPRAETKRVHPSMKVIHLDSARKSEAVIESMRLSTINPYPKVGRPRKYPHD